MHSDKVRVRLHSVLLLSSILVLLSFTSVVFANWHVYKRIEITNEQGHHLRFESINGEYIRIWLRLGQEEKGAFSPEKLLKYRVDQNIIHTIKKDPVYKNLKMKIGHYIYWTISSCKIVSESLKEIANGQEIVFQYYCDNNKIVESVFSLKNFKKKLQEIFPK